MHFLGLLSLLKNQKNPSNNNISRLSSPTDNKKTKEEQYFMTLHQNRTENPYGKSKKPKKPKEPKKPKKPKKTKKPKKPIFQDSSSRWPNFEESLKIGFFLVFVGFFGFFGFFGFLVFLVFLVFRTDLVESPEILSFLGFP